MNCARVVIILIPLLTEQDCIIHPIPFVVKYWVYIDFSLLLQSRKTFQDRTKQLAYFYAQAQSLGMHHH
jgi:hypothetical protein